MILKLSVISNLKVGLRQGERNLLNLSIKMGSRILRIERGCPVSLNGTAKEHAPSLLLYRINPILSIQIKDKDLNYVDANE